MVEAFASVIVSEDRDLLLSIDQRLTPWVFLIRYTLPEPVDLRADQVIPQPAIRFKFPEVGVSHLGNPDPRSQECLCTIVAINQCGQRE